MSIATAKCPGRTNDSSGICLQTNTPLDKNTRNVTTRDRRHRNSRYELRTRLQAFTPNSRLANCGRCRINPHVEVRMAGGRSYYAGVMHCGLVWLCPVCAHRRTTHRRQQVRQLLVDHLAGGNGAEFLTLTLPHHAADKLANTWPLATNGWKRVQQGGAWTRLKAAIGIIGTIRVLEVTYSVKHGWHPHIHVVLLTRGKLTHEERATLHAHCFSAWHHAVVKAGHPAPQRACTVLVPVVDAEMGSYCLKFGERSSAAHEDQAVDPRTAPETDRTQAQQMTPFDILAALLATGDERYVRAWREWESGSRDS